MAPRRMALVERQTSFNTGRATLGMFVTCRLHAGLLWSSAHTDLTNQAVVSRSRLL